MSDADIVDPVVGMIYNMLRCPEAKAEFKRLGILKRMYECVSFRVVVNITISRECECRCSSLPNHC